MRELVAVLIFGIATLASAYLFGLLGYFFTGIFIILEHIPEWVWSLTLLSLTIVISRGLPSSSA
jgi:hypothetical protein